MQFDYPYHFDGRRRTASTDAPDHIRDLVEQVLFTRPGERVNRPDFGSGLLQLTFEPLSDELAAATSFLVRGSLEQWLGQVISVDDLQVEADDGVLRVFIGYTVRRTGEQRTATFERPGAGP
jgi:phage baseplate assembly protein W